MHKRDTTSAINVPPPCRVSPEDGTFANSRPQWQAPADPLNTALLAGTAALSVHPVYYHRTSAPAAAYARASPLRLAEDEFTASQQLRAEVESPFAQVRLFALPVLFGGATIATYFGATELLASAAGLRESSTDAVQNLVIDIASMGSIGFFWKRELDVREARLKRIAFGSRLAALRVQQLEPTETWLKPGIGVTLADLRRGRGQARRVVIICAPAEALRSSLNAATTRAAELAAEDFLIVPLVIAGDSTSRSGATPLLSAPELGVLQEMAEESPALARIAAKRPTAVVAQAPSKETQPPLPWDEAMPDVAAGWPVALPQGGGAAWAAALSSELEQAIKQDATALDRGLTIVLKKNGRVGTRRLGMPAWDGLLGDVASRRRSGFDVTNI